MAHPPLSPAEDRLQSVEMAIAWLTRAVRVAGDEPHGTGVRTHLYVALTALSDAEELLKDRRSRASAARPPAVAWTPGVAAAPRR